MPNDFIVRPKCTDKKEDKSITMTIRLERSSRRRLLPPTSHTTGHAVPHPAVQLT